MKKKTANSKPKTLIRPRAKGCRRSSFCSSADLRSVLLDVAIALDVEADDAWRKCDNMSGLPEYKTVWLVTGAFAKAIRRACRSSVPGSGYGEGKVL